MRNRHRGDVASISIQRRLSLSFGAVRRHWRRYHYSEKRLKGSRGGRAQDLGALNALPAFLGNSSLAIDQSAAGTSSQKSALLPNTRASISAVSAAMARRLLHSSLTCLRGTPMACAIALRQVKRAKNSSTRISPMVAGLRLAMVMARLTDSARQSGIPERDDHEAIPFNLRQCATPRDKRQGTRWASIDVCQ